MVHIAQDSLATIYFRFFWKSSHATHVERFLADDVSLTRDILPVGVKSRLIGLGVGDTVSMVMDMAEVPPFKPGKVLDMPAPRFVGDPESGREIRPRIGRFYPKHYIEDVPGTRPDSVSPFRVVEVDKAGFKADLNHPMAGREVTIKATVLDIRPPATEAGSLHRWPETMLAGPGMQARLPETPTDFLGNDPFCRLNEAENVQAYAGAMPVDHLDAPARESVRRAYGRLLSDGDEVLDLMAGAHSRLPEKVKLASVTGLGMSMDEMQDNPALTERVVHNLNEEPAMPFAEARFDAVLCTSSVEYLTQPFEVFEEVVRVLKSGGVFALAFTNRWDAQKVIAIWPELYDFERMGLVCQYFMRTGLFTDVNTASERGWPQTEDFENRFGKGLAESDPAYMIWGFRK